MPTAITQRTAGQVLVDIAKLTGDWINEGTATATFAGTNVTDANNERTPIGKANVVKGTYIYIYAGTSAGTAREINDYTTIGVMPWTETATTLDGTSLWVRLRRRPQNFLDAIAAVTRENQRRLAFTRSDDAIVSGSLLGYYGGFEAWPGGAATAPDDWVLAGAGAAVARESTIRGHGDYSVKLTAGGAALGTLTYTVPMRRLRGLDSQSLKLIGMLANTAAADAVVRATTKAGLVAAVNTDRTSTYTTNEWQELKDISDASITLPDRLISLEVQLRAVASAACYFDDIHPISPLVNEYDLPDDLIGFASPWLSLESSFGRRDYVPALMKGRDWFVDERTDTGNPVLRMINRPADGLHLKYEGIWQPAVVTATTTNLEIDSEYLTHAVAARLLQQDVAAGLKQPFQAAYETDKAEDLRAKFPGATFHKPGAFLIRGER